MTELFYWITLLDCAGVPNKVASEVNTPEVAVRLAICPLMFAD